MLIFLGETLKEDSRLHVYTSFVWAAFLCVVVFQALYSCSFPFLCSIFPTVVSKFIYSSVP